MFITFHILFSQDAILKTSLQIKSVEITMIHEDHASVTPITINKFITYWGKSYNNMQWHVHKTLIALHLAMSDINQTTENICRFSASKVWFTKKFVYTRVYLCEFYLWFDDNMFKMRYRSASFCKRVERLTAKD